MESGEPTYLRSRITRNISRRALRSSTDDKQLEPCSSHTKIRSRAFRCAVPAIWNCLPHDNRAASSASNFRSRFKMHYFKTSLSTSYIHFKRSWYQLFYAPLIQFHDLFLGKIHRIAFRLMLSCVCVCVCVCVSMCACVCVSHCVYAAFVDLRKTVWDREVVFFPNCAE